MADLKEGGQYAGSVVDEAGRWLTKPVDEVGNFVFTGAAGSSDTTTDVKAVIGHRGYWSDGQVEALEAETEYWGTDLHLPSVDASWVPLLQREANVAELIAADPLTGLGGDLLPRDLEDPELDWFSTDRHATSVDTAWVPLLQREANAAELDAADDDTESYQHDSGQQEEYWGNVYGFPDPLDVVAALFPPPVTEPFIAQYPLAEQPWFPDEDIDYARPAVDLDGSPIFVAVSSYSDLVIRDGARGYWRLDEPSGATVFDSSGNGLTGTWNGTPTQNVPGLIDGPDTAAITGDNFTYVDLSSPVDLRLTSEFTLEGWVQVKAGDTQASAFIAHEYNGTTVNYMLGFFDGTTTSLQPSVGFYNGAWHVAQSPDPIATGEPHHIVGTWDGTSLRIYVNGALKNTSTPGSGPIASTQRFLLDSRWDSTAPHKFDGTSDELAIYGGALSAAQIAEHFAVGTSGRFSAAPYSVLEPYADVEHDDYDYWTADPTLDVTPSLFPPAVANDSYIAALDLPDQQDFSEPEWEYGPLIDEQEELIAGPPDADHITQAAQPHYGELPIPEDATEDYANDATVDTSWAMDFASGDEVTIATEPLAEQPWFPDQDIDTELANDTTLDVAPLTVAPDAFDLTIATQPLAEQPWFEAPDIDSEADNDTAIEVVAQLFQPDVTDEFQAAQYALPEQPWFADQETEDYDDSSTLDVTPAFAPPLFIADTEGTAATQVFEQDIANTFPDPDPTNDQPLVDGAVEALQSPNDAFDVTMALQEFPGDDTWTIQGEDPFIPDANVEQNEFLGVASDDSYIAALDLPDQLWFEAQDIDSEADNDSALDVTAQFFPATDDGYIAALDLLPQPFDEDPEQPDTFIEHATVAFLAGDDGYIAALELPDQWADALDETPEQPDTPLDTEWAQALALTDALIAAVHHLAVEVDAHFIPEPEINSNLSTTEVVAQLFPPPPPSGTGPDVFTAVLRPRWHASATLRWAASSEPRWRTNRIRARWLAWLRSRIG